jgi:protein O-mannosyl-transferase
VNSPSPERAANRSRRFLDALFHPLCLSLLLGAITFIAFWPVLRCDFITYDDPVYFTNNARVQSGLTSGGTLWAFRTGLMGNWNPALWLSYMLDVELFGQGPAGPHFTNLALHAVNAILVFLLFNTLTGARWRSWTVAALFALHPLRVESVAWISERKDVLSGCFGLLALLMYARYAKKVEPGQGSGPTRQSPRPRFLHSAGFGLALIFFVLGLMTKPMLITLPLVMLLLDYWPLRRFTTENIRATFRPLILEKIPFLIPAVLVGLTTLLMHRHLGGLASLAESPPTARLGNALVSYLCYLGRTFWPVQMILPYPRVERWPLTFVLLSAALMAGACLAAILLGRKQPHVFTGWFWFVGMLIPVIGIIQWGEQSMADRFTYLPAIGLFLLLVWVIGETFSESSLAKTILTGGAALALVACALTTRAQLSHWRNSETLFRHSLSVSENNHVAWSQLGLFALQQGRMDEATGYFANALKVNPDYAPALNNLGALLFRKGLVDDAEACIQKSIQLNPHDASAHFNLGQVRVARRKFDVAIGNFETALQLAPDYFEARYNLAVVLIQLNRLDDAVQQLRLITRQKPDDAKVLSNLGSALAMKGELDEAIACFRKAIHFSPENAQTHFNLGNALVQQHQADEAIVQFKEALRLDPGYLEAKQKLRALGVAVSD